MENYPLKDWSSLYQMGLAMIRWKAYSEAIVCFEKAQRVKPSAMVASHLGSLLFMQDREHEAETLFQAAAKDFPQSKELFFNFAGMRVDQGRYEEAKALFLQALTIDPSDEHSARGLAYCEAALKRA